MTLLSPAPSPLEDVYVSLDLETTGLDPEREDIIEIGAVKFRGDEVLATFQTLVNPRRELSSFVIQLTGIAQRQVDAAPPLSDVAGQLLTFLGPLPLVGHSVAFDLGFLAKAGLGLSNPCYDTQDMASVFLPGAEGYALAGLASALGISHGRPHRALEDARICHHLFLALLCVALKQDPGLLAAVGAIAARSSWPMRGLLVRLEEAASRNQGGQRASPALGLMGVPVAGLAGRLERPRPLQQRRTLEEVDPDAAAAILGDGGTLSKALPSYEHRPQQVEMARAVTEALNQGHHLMVEAGTGVGKSVAYLLPAMLFAVRNGQRVVVSTSTINLQEQLVAKDIPALLEAMQGEP
ncbi:MAG: exonuclease domain-containing protein, partial [Chloroflexota bacterium]